MLVLIVDDEPLARRRLARILASWNDVEVVGEAGDGAHARESITATRPDVILLDVDMPEVDGLTLAADADIPPVVFVTAYAEHAVRAFELAAVDYLLKPVEAPRLRQAIDRARRRGGIAQSDLRAVFRHARASEAAPPRLVARRGSTAHWLDLGDVTRLRAADKYVLVHVGGREYVLDESLAELQARLEPHGFLRIHRAELVAASAIVSLSLLEGEAHVTLRDGQRAPVSRRSLAGLRRRLAPRP